MAFTIRLLCELPYKHLTKEEQTKLLYAEALNNHGLNYFFGKAGFPLDRAKAIFLFRDAAQLGSASGQYNLAIIIENHPEFFAETPKISFARLQTAVAWYKIAAEQGHPSACFRLAMMHLDPKCTLLVRSVRQAEEYLIIAAQKNLPEAQYQLAMHYLHTKDDKGHLIGAIHWLRCAKNSRYEPADNKLAHLQHIARFKCERDRDIIEALFPTPTAHPQIRTSPWVHPTHSPIIAGYVPRF